MGRALSWLRAVESALGALLFLRVVTSANSDLGALYLIVIYCMLVAPIVLLGLWCVFAYRQHRRMATWIVVIPIAIVVSSIAIRVLNGAPVAWSALLRVAIAAAVIVSVVLIVNPAKIARFVPPRMLHSRVLNFGIVAILIVAWAFALAVFSYAMTQDFNDFGGQGSPRMGAGVIVLFSILCIIGLGLIGSAATAWGWMAHRTASIADLKPVHRWQMLLGAPALIVGGLAWMWTLQQT